MTAAPDPHSHTHHHEHGHDHHHHGEAHHGHSHGPETPHPPSALPISLLRWSLGSRLGVACVAIAALWGVVLFAMR
jgi:hypothetical protein